MQRNIAVVGNGYWGKNLIRNFAELGALGAICDESPVAEASAKERYPDIPFYRSYAEALAAPQIEGLVLATPAATHYAMARQALEAGKDVLVEKPLALSVPEGEALVELASRHRRILMVGHILRYHPAVLRLKDLIHEGSLGRIQYLYSNRLNIGKIRTEENILWSFAPHDISVMLALLGEEPCHVACEGGGYLNHNVADVTLSQFLFPSGVRAHIFVSWLHPFKEQRLVVVGSEKMAVFDDAATDKLILYPHKVEWKNRLPTAIKAEGEALTLSAAEPLKEECRHFLDCMVSREAPITNGDEGLRVLRVLRACQEALQSKPATRPMPSTDHAEVPKPYFAHATATVGKNTQIGEGSKIWHYSHIMNNVQIGKQCIFGQNCHVAEGVVIGNNVKVQNNVSIYMGTVVEDDVFLGPSCVLTNVTNPRSQVNRHALYEKTLLRRGATVGANATIVCGVELGRYSFVGAGAVVTRNVPDYALVVGNPGRQVGWMSRHGHQLVEREADGTMICPESGYRYREIAPGVLRCLDLDEDSPLPSALAIGNRSYDEYKASNSISA